MRTAVAGAVARIGRTLAAAATVACSRSPAVPGAPGAPAASPAHEPTSTAPASEPPAPSGPARSAVAAPLPAGAGRKMTVRFYDVGEGLAVLVDLPDGRRVLVDTGDGARRAGCGGVCAKADRHLMARLRADLGSSPIALLWITHQHADHIGGAAEVLATFPTEAYVDNGRDGDKPEVRAARRAARGHGASVHVVDPAHRDVPLAPSPDVRVTAVVPPAWPASCAHDPNECSIGLRIDDAASSVLFTGDAEREEEARLEPLGPVALLQVAHHGSGTSTSPAFLAEIAPRYAVISAGKPDEGYNRAFCHPRALVVQRLTRVLGGRAGRPIEAFDGARCDRATASDWSDVAASDRLWATSRDGDVVLWTDGDGRFHRQAP